MLSYLSLRLLSSFYSNGWMMEHDNLSRYVVSVFSPSLFLSLPLSSPFLVCYMCAFMPWVQHNNNKTFHITCYTQKYHFVLRFYPLWGRTCEAASIDDDELEQANVEIHHTLAWNSQEMRATWNVSAGRDRENEHSPMHATKMRCHSGFSSPNLVLFQFSFVVDTINIHFQHNFTYSKQRGTDSQHNCKTNAHAYRALVREKIQYIYLVRDEWRGVSAMCIQRHQDQQTFSSFLDYLLSVFTFIN